MWQVQSGICSVTVGGWNCSHISGFQGFRISLYFEPFDQFKEVITDEEKFPNGLYSWDDIRKAEKLLGKNLEMIQLGEVKDIVTQMADANRGFTWKASNLSVKQRMAENKMSSENFKTININSYFTYLDDMNKDFKNDFKSIIKKTVDIGTVDKERWLKFFISTDPYGNGEVGAKLDPKEDWPKRDISNTISAIKLIIEGNEDLYTQGNKDLDTELEENFKNGVLYLNGQEIRGVYKLYFEPIFAFQISSSKNYVLTIRDLIAFAKCNTGMTFDLTNQKGLSVMSAVHTASIDVSNSSYLTKDEPAVDMYGTSSKISSPSTNSTSKMYQSGGVGVIYGCPPEDISSSLLAKMPVEITTYAMIDTVSLNNGELNITYKDAGIPSEMENVKYRLDGDGNVSNIPLIEDVKYSGTYTAYLNDIVTTKYDLRSAFDGNTTEWINTDLVTGLNPVVEKDKETGQQVTKFNGTLNANTTDVSGYRFGLIVGSDTFLEQMANIFNSRGENITGDLTHTNDEVDGVSVIQALNSVMKNNDSNSAYIQVNMMSENGVQSMMIRNLSGNNTINRTYGNGASQGTGSSTGLRTNTFNIVISTATPYSYMAQQTDENGDTITYINFSYSAWQSLINRVNQGGGEWLGVTSDLLFEVLYDEVITVGALIGAKDKDGNVNFIAPAVLDDEFKEFFNPEIDNSITEQEYIQALRERATGSTSLHNYRCFNNYLNKNESNTLILRYILVPKPVQTNLVKIYKQKPDNTEELVQVIVEESVDLVLDEETKTVEIQKPVTDVENKISGPDLVEWRTNPSFPIIDMTQTKDLPTEYDTNGDTEDPIPDYPTDPVIDNLYVEWKIVIPPTPVPTVTQGRDTVPEWRLSKYTNSVVNKLDNPYMQSAFMSMSLSGDNTSHKTSTFSPSGNYNFSVINPNGLVNNNSKSPSNMKMNTITDSKGLGYTSGFANTYFHSETLAKSTDSVSHSKPYANIKLDATLKSIKSDDNGKLIVANWIPASYGNLNDIGDYTIKGATLPVGYNTLAHYTQTADLFLNIYNKDTYTHQIAVYYHYTYWCSSDYCSGHDRCRCYLTPEYFSPSSPYYNGVRYVLGVTFDRYIQSDTSSRKLTVQPKITESNAKTTLKYQLNENLTIYPEYGMLLAKDDGNSNNDVIKFVISDKARTIAPVVYQTLEHKVYVVPTSSGSSVATDTRALTQARTIGESGKQVIYKGANVNTTFQLYRTDAKNSKALLTVRHGVKFCVSENRQSQGWR